MNRDLRAFLRLCGGRLLLVVASFAPLAGGSAPAVGSSQDYLIHVWRAEEGLPHNSILSLAQTADHYLWIGTRSGGLARFDGVRFVAFNPQTTPELRDIEIEELSLDRRGKLWIATGNESLTTYHQGRFELARRERAEPRWHPARMLAHFPDGIILTAREGRLYFLPSEGKTDEAVHLAPRPLPRWDGRGSAQEADGTLWYITRRNELGRSDGKEFGPFPLNSIPFRPPFRDVAVDARGRVWLASRDRIAILDGDTFRDCTPTNGPAPFSIQRLVTVRDGMWICEADRIRKAAGEQWLVEAQDHAGFPSGTAPPARAIADQAGGLWIFDYGVGLIHVNSSGRVRRLTEAEGLPSTLITCYLEDREGNIWVGTLDGGLARIRPRLFKVFSTAEGLPDEAVQSVCQDQAGVIWAGTVSGQLARRKGERFETVSLAQTERYGFETLTLFPGGEGALWIASPRGGTLLLKDGEATRPYPPNAGGPRGVRILLRDHADRVWFGGGTGLFLLENGQVRKLEREDGFVSGVGVGAITQDGCGTVWVGTGPGELWKYVDGQFTSFRPPSDWPPSRLSALLAHTNEVVWIGTLSGGLVRFKNGQFVRITSVNGLPDDFITQLQEDQRGYLWAGTYSGIFRARIRDLEAVADGRSFSVVCERFGPFDGLPTSECAGGFFHPACWRDHDGQLWFATLKGLVCVDPTQVTVNRRPPPVRIEEFRVNGRPREFRPAALAQVDPGKRGSRHEQPLQVEPGRHTVQFRVTAFNFMAPDAVHFRWKLEGAEEEWQDGGHDRVVSYGPLLPGNYRFRVMAANSSGIWNEEGSVLAFTVLPYVWETWWFKAVFIGTLFGLLALVVAATIRRRYAWKLQRLQREREVDRERARIAQDLHDDLGTNLTQISLLSALVSSKNTPQNEIEQLTRAIRAKTRQMVSDLNQIVWAVNPRNNSLNEVFGYLGGFAEEFLHATNIRCRLDFPDQVSNATLSAETRHNLFLAYKEALNNAAKYSTATEITVSARETAGTVTVCVQDNGKGFVLSAAADGGGNGLLNMRQRLDKIRGTCELSSTPGEGTTVRFQFPK